MFNRIQEQSPAAFDIVRHSLEAGALMGSLGGVFFQNVTGVLSGAVLGFGCGAFINVAKNIEPNAILINCLSSPFFTYSAGLVAKEILPNSTLGQIARFTIVTTASIGVGIYAAQRADLKLKLEDIVRIATANAIIQTVAATLPTVAATLPIYGRHK